ncbi:MAG: dienelactone hydrolase family protein [Candidatus Acidiferrum sp.]
MTLIPSKCTGRIEIYPISTQTLSDHQFLSGNKNGPAAVIAGELRQPVGDGPFPVVVLVHGSGGVSGNVDRWAVELNRLGVAAFILDCFSGRGIRSTIPDQSRLGSLAMIFDAYRALEFLTKQPSFDANRIALMGFSRGGFATLYASMKRFQAYFAPPGAEFAAYLPFYPRCDITFSQDEDVADRPIRIFHGEADDWVPVEPVRRYVARLQAAGKDVSLTTYPGARHAFDSTTYPPLFTFGDAEISSHCRLAEKDAQIINLDTGKPFTNQDACVTRGASVGSNEGAYQKAHADVKKFLSALFHLT